MSRQAVATLPPPFNLNVHTIFLDFLNTCLKEYSSFFETNQVTLLLKLILSVAPDFTSSDIEFSLRYLAMLCGSMSYILASHELFLSFDALIEFITVNLAQSMTSYNVNSFPSWHVSSCISSLETIFSFFKDPLCNTTSTTSNRKSLSSSSLPVTKASAMNIAVQLMLNHFKLQCADEHAMLKGQEFVITKDILKILEVLVSVNASMPFFLIRISHSELFKKNLVDFLTNYEFTSSLFVVEPEYLVFILENFEYLRHDSVIIELIGQCSFVCRNFSITQLISTLSALKQIYLKFQNFPNFALDVLHHLSFALKNQQPDVVISYIAQIFQFILNFCPPEIQSSFATVFGSICQNNQQVLLNLTFLLRSCGANIRLSKQTNQTAITTEGQSNADVILQSILSQVSSSTLATVATMMSFIDSFTLLSLELKEVAKSDRLPVLRQKLTQMTINGLLPDGVSAKGIVLDKCLCLKSHAKVPILLTFTTAQKSEVSWIFKSSDDVRQDSLALQLIFQMKQILISTGLDLFLLPYLTIPTSTNDGVIEVIANSKSRDQIGGDSDGGLIDWFESQFGDKSSERFASAQLEFVKSMAAYSLVTFILAVKDRHNGNIMFDKDGHVIHIDFGFIFDVSPGGDFRFETAPFKLSREMFDLMGGRVDSPTFELFVSLIVKGYLAVRQHSNLIISLVNLMLDAGLECFKTKTIENLKIRLSYGKTDLEAVSNMMSFIRESNCNYRTAIYDEFQSWQNNISKPPLLYDIGITRRSGRS
ncbi:hypothetical protein GEMRC1_009128 [Eukaryota sp. GEM-RC1]